MFARACSDFFKLANVFPVICPLLCARAILSERAFFSWEIWATTCFRFSTDFTLNFPNCAFSLLNSLNWSNTSSSFEVSSSMYPAARPCTSPFLWPAARVCCNVSLAFLIALADCESRSDCCAVVWPNSPAACCWVVWPKMPDPASTSWPKISCPVSWAIPKPCAALVVFLKCAASGRWSWLKISCPKIPNPSADSVVLPNDESNSSITLLAVVK